MKKIFLAIGFAFLNCISFTYLSAQNSSLPGYSAVFPPSPNASSLGRFGDVPVSLYTGTTDINIPIWSLKGKGITIPVSLRYHAGGVRVDEVASNVGTNWALDAGGQVTRVVMGNADDDPAFLHQGYLNKGQPVPDHYTNEVDYNNFGNGSMDTQPDLFQFSLPGASGKFSFNYDGTIVLTPYQKIDIQYLRPMGYGYITSWTITTDDGIMYTMDQVEQNKNIVMDVLGSGVSAPLSDFYTSTWYLSNISTPQGESVNFVYENYSVSYQLQDQEIKYSFVQAIGNPCGTDPLDKRYVSTTQINGKRLKTITLQSSGESITFQYEKNRIDLANDQALTQIDVSNSLNEIVRQFKLGYQYLAGGTTLSDLPDSTTPSDINYRLMLKTVTECNGAMTKPSYIFDYALYANGYTFPPRLSKQQDHWGFFNGQPNTTLCPRQYVTSAMLNIPGKTLTLTGGNRASNPALSFLGTLNKITYPTGGSTIFEYSSHDHSNVLADPDEEDYTFYFSLFPTYTSNVSTFTVGQGISSYATVDFSLPLNASTNLNDPNYVNASIIQMEIVDVSTNTVVYNSQPHYNSATNTYSQSQFTPTPGSTYKVIYSGITVKSTDNSPYDLVVKWHEDIVNTELYSGGARVTKTTDYDPVTGKTMVKKYQYTLQDGTTSGMLLTIPKYGFITETVPSSIDCINEGSSYVADYWTRKNSPNYTLNSTQGSYVGYSRVVVLEGENGENGKSIYYYTNNPDIPNVNSDDSDWPPVPDESRAWQRGVLTLEEHYMTGATSPNRSIKNNYNFLTYENVINPNTYNKVIQASKVEGTCPSGGYCNASVFSYNFYKIGTGYNDLYETIETQTEAGGLTITVTKELIHDLNTLLLKSEQITGSNGKSIVKTYNYPDDYSDTTFGSDVLRRQKMHNPILQELSSVNGLAVQKVCTTYSSINGHVLPVTLSVYPDGVTENMKIVTNYNYDLIGNVIGEKRINNFPKCYLWGYGGSLPIAMIDNATYDQVSLTSFETSEQGGWTYAGSLLVGKTPSGEKFYDLASGDIVKSNTGASLSNVYVLRFLARSSNGSQQTWNFMGKSEILNSDWKIICRDVTSSSLTISATGVYIDDLKLVPKYSEITSYTYHPSVGVTSRSDLSGRVSSYEYDALGRLIVVRDHEGKVINIYNYKYKEQ